MDFVEYALNNKPAKSVGDYETVVTVSFQAHKAANRNLAEVLRYE